MRMLLQVPGESGEEDKARPTSLQQPQIAAINHRQRDEIEAYCRTQSAHSFQNFNWDTSSIPASNKSWRSSDGSYADGESALFEPLDIPGFPLPPPMIPTPMHIGLASPPPTIPCPPLPADYFGPGKVYGNNYFPHHRAVTSHNGAGTASRPPATALADYITSQPRISLHKNGVARDGDAQYAGLEVATRNMEPLPQNTVPTKPHTQPLSARRHSTSSLATSTVSSRFCYHPEMQRLPSPPCTPSLSARKTEPFAVAQPKFKTTDLDFDPGLAISKETFISCVDQQKNGSSDRCIEEYQMLPLFPIPQNDFQAPNKSSNRKMALHNKQLALHSTNPLDDGSLQQTEMTNNPTRYLDFEYGLRSDARSSSRYSSEEIQPATAQTTHENEFAKARSDAAGSSGPFSDILHCRDGPDEDLRGDRMLPHSTWRIRNWSHFSWNTPRDALELPSTDEKEAGGHKIKSTSPTSSQGAFCRKHDQRAQQQPSSTYRDILRRNRVAWGISGGVSVLLITLLLLMLLIVYPSIIQKSLNKAQFTLIDLNLQDPNIDSFILSLDLNLNNNGEFEGELLPMEANLGAYIPRYDNQNTTISRRKLFPEDYAVNTIQRRNKLAADYGGFLHKLKMPQIVFGGTAARLVKLPKTRVDNVNTGTNWGGVLAKAFHRDHVALDLKGDGYFRKGGLKAKVALDRSIDLVGLNDPTRLVTRSNSGLLNWTLVTDPSTKYTTLYGQSQFPNPTNVSMFMGNLTFDFRHREISIGKLLVRDYNLHPGLNGAVQFSASLRYGAFDYETMSGFLTTLMTWNPQWGDGFPYDYKFQVVGESAVIDHVEIPWLSQAVRGIKDNVYVLANQPWGYGDVSKITTRPQINRLGLRFSDIKPSIGSSVLQGRATKGRMVLSVILPVNMVDFSLDVQSVTHEISFVDPSTNFTYAKIDVIDPENTFTRTEPVKDLVEGYQRAKTRKLMLVGLENTRLTIFNGDIFGQLMLKPTLANEEISVLVRTDSVLKVLTPLGLGEIRNITHEAEIKMSGMGINRKDGPLEIKNTKVVSGQAGSPGESPSLELTADLHISSLGDMELEIATSTTMTLLWEP
ncbi:hypothetical protein DFH27DRAFT_35633 [Peziza echinospora]|nr:hypothetical protein DFH27DRAFT_35633 [Peziza echinospora]